MTSEDQFKEERQLKWLRNSNAFKESLLQQGREEGREEIICAMLNSTSLSVSEIAKICKVSEQTVLDVQEKYRSS